MAIQIQFRRDTSLNWEAMDPILALGEPGLDTDTGDMKIGDGVTRWTNLPFKTGNEFSGSYNDLTNVPAKVVSVPASAFGAEGDLAGQIAYDTVYIYICIADYVGDSTQIWRRVNISADYW